MATGIEMLGQMGTDQSLAGPVEGGNMVVKPNQVPVGGAAMLAKALRGQANKGVGGMYVLPEQEESMPGFMQMAQQNVNEDMTRMARTVEAEAPPGHMLSYITPEEAGILKLLGGTGDINPVTGIPQFPPQTEEQAMRTFGAKKASSVNKSSDRQPGGRAATEKVGKQYEADVAKVGVEKAQERFMERGREAQKDPSQFAPVDYFGDKEEIEEETVSVTEHQNKADSIQSQLDELNKKRQEGKLGKADKKLFKSLNKEKKSLDKILQKIFKDQQEAKYGDMDVEGISETDIKKLRKQIDRYGFDSLNTADQKKWKAIQSSKDKHPGIKMLDTLGLSQDIPGVHASIKTLGDDNTLALVGFNQGHLGKDGKLTEKGKAFYNQYDDKMGFVGMESVEDYEKKLGSLYSFDDEGNVKMESDILGGTQAQRAIDPEEYYLGSDKAKYYGRGATSGSMEELAGVALTGDKNFDRRIIEAREIVNRDKADHGQGRRPQFMDAVEEEEEVIETPTGVVDEEAQTMAYTGPRTGGVETQVPLQRRFKTDPTQDVAQYTTTPRTQEDVYKYMTEGTTGEGIGLEPFSDYQKRRRKALGLEPLGLWS